MALNNRDEDTDISTNDCDNCGSTELLSDDTRGDLFCLGCGYVCNDNELAIDGLEMTWGENPQNTPSEELGSARMPAARPADFAGTALDYRRRRSSDGRARFTPPPYVIRAARTLEPFDEPRATVKRVQSILAEADSLKNEVSLADQRPPLKGYSRLPKGNYEQSEYRRKALALAALAVDDSRGRPNRYRVLADSMNVDVEDVVRLKKMIAKRVTDKERIRLQELANTFSDPSEMARVLREAMLVSAVDHIHSFLHDLTTASGTVTALDIRIQTFRILRESQEPVRGSQMGHGQYTPYSPHKAAMLATFEAIKALGLPLELCRQLYSSVPVARMKTNMRRITSWWNSTDEAESGEAAGHS